MGAQMETTERVNSSTISTGSATAQIKIMKKKINWKARELRILRHDPEVVKSVEAFRKMKAEEAKNKKNKCK